MFGQLGINLLPMIALPVCCRLRSVERKDIACSIRGKAFLEYHVRQFCFLPLEMSRPTKSHRALQAGYAMTPGLDITFCNSLQLIRIIPILCESRSRLHDPSDSHNAKCLKAAHSFNLAHTFILKGNQNVSCHIPKGCQPQLVSQQTKHESAC